MVLKDDRRWVIHMGLSYARKIVLIYKEMGYLYEEICFHTRKWIICMSHSYKELSYSYKFCIQGKEFFIYKEMSYTYTKMSFEKWSIHIHGGYRWKEMSCSNGIFICKELSVSYTRKLVIHTRKQVFRTRKWVIHTSYSYNEISNSSTKKWVIHT